jgi:uncharacterized membrane protein HdeD (DUF308 family)
MGEEKKQNYTSMWLLGLVCIPLGVILLNLGPQKAPLGVILIAIGGFYIITAIRKKKKEKSEEKGKVS